MHKLSDESHRVRWEVSLSIKNVVQAYIAVSEIIIRPTKQVNYHLKTTMFNLD
ncbi:hypothetical protein HFZ78_16650 [Priestia megaterium]|uniref:Uncharacterized protein n=1 Tax=Priestia megaterium TaxID=1404 RepID=A0A6H1P418_PRIMG|nr:hypothetical protein [Priestia megaterium]QIZ08157.1 hypothetical protein HFZ78_16650 [Priestia megaterium]